MVTYNGSWLRPDTRTNVPAYQLQAYSAGPVLMERPGGRNRW